METTIARCWENPSCPQTSLYSYSHAHVLRYSNNRGVPKYFSSRFLWSLDVNKLCCANSASNWWRLRAVLTQQDGVVSAAAPSTTEKVKESEPPFRLAEGGVDGAATSPTGGIESTVSITVVGASGDLAKKKIFPALFALYYEDCLPEHCTIYGYARSKMTDAELRNMISGKMTCRIDKRANIKGSVSFCSTSGRRNLVWFELWISDGCNFLIGRHWGRWNRRRARVYGLQIPDFSFALYFNF